MDASAPDTPGRWRTARFVDDAPKHDLLAGTAALDDDRRCLRRDPRVDRAADGAAASGLNDPRVGAIDRRALQRRLLRRRAGARLAARAGQCCCRCRWARAGATIFLCKGLLRPEQGGSRGGPWWARIKLKGEGGCASVERRPSGGRGARHLRHQNQVGKEDVGCAGASFGWGSSSASASAWFDSPLHVSRSPTHRTG